MDRGRNYRWTGPGPHWARDQRTSTATTPLTVTVIYQPGLGLGALHFREGWSMIRQLEEIINANSVLISVWYCWSIMLLWGWYWDMNINTVQSWYDCLLLLEIQMWQRENTVVISGQRFWIHYRLSVMRSDHYLDTAAPAKLPGYSRKTHFCTIWRNRPTSPGPGWWGNNVVGVSLTVALALTVSHWLSPALTDKQSFRSLDRQTDRPIGQPVHLDWWIKIITIETVPTTNMWPTLQSDLHFTFSFAEHKLETGKKMNQIFCNLHNLHELWTDVIVLLNKNTSSDLSNFDQQNHLLGLIHRDYGGD